MLRRLSPYLIVILAVLLDTAVLPVFYYGTLTVPLTLAVVLCVGLTLGKLRGALLGMVGGLLIDISCGTLGMMTFFFMACGFLIALLLEESNPSAPQPTGLWFHARHALVIAVLYLLGEAVFCFYRYFVTAHFEWYYLRSILQRDLVFTIASLMLYSPLARLFLGKRKEARATFGKTREVKHF